MFDGWLYNAVIIPYTAYRCITPSWAVPSKIELVV
jgi:hypothetical protein